MAVGEAELVGRVAMAAVLGAGLGFERESRGKAAGLRTHALVAAGAALFTLAGSVGAGPGAGPSESTRVAAQVATGIGFIGAGTIVRTGATVRGLTTAATLWLAASLGVASAFGMYVTSIGAVVIIILVVVGLDVLKPMASRRHRRAVWIRYERGHGTLGPLLRGLEDAGCEVHNLHIDDVNDGSREVSIDVLSGDDGAFERITAAIQDRAEVRSLHVRAPSATTLRAAGVRTLRRHRNDPQAPKGEQEETKSCS
jgi:putative Mg2+ transporter-C (MgtC) family protein